VDTVLTLLLGFAEYQPVRVLMSVLLTDAANTRMSTSSGPACGVAMSSRHINLSSPPWPVKTMALMDVGSGKVSS
jgi:hypothetical protein